MSKDADATSKRQIGLYKGRPVESMTREELIAAVNELGELYTDFVNSQFDTVDREVRRIFGIRRSGE